MLEKLLPARPPKAELSEDHEEVELHAYQGSTGSHGGGASGSRYDVDDDDDEMGGGHGEPKVQCAHQ